MNNQSNTQKPSRRTQVGMGGPMMRGMGGKPKNFKESIKKLAKYIKPHLPKIITSIVFSITATVLSIIAPTYMGDLTNEIGVSFMGIQINLDNVASIAVTLIVFYGTILVLNYLQSFIMAGMTQRVAKSLRTDISVKINKVPLKYYDQINYGDVLSRVTNDVDTIGQTLSQSISGLVSSTIMLIGVLIAMFVTSWQLAITAVLTVPLSFILIMIITKISRKHFRANQKHLGNLNGQIEENYSGLSVIKAFNGQTKTQESFDAPLVFGFLACS